MIAGLDGAGCTSITFVDGSQPADHLQARAAADQSTF
jgi:hypothetical protein